MLTYLMLLKTAVFVADANIDQVNVTGDRLRGEIGSDVDIIGVQVNWRF